MRVFLTGATVFIGQSLTKALLERGWKVIALVRKPDSLEARAVVSILEEEHKLLTARKKCDLVSRL